MNNLARALWEVLLYQVGEVEDCPLNRVSDVNWFCVILIHQPDDAIDQVMDVLERPCLGAVPIHSQIPVLETLDDEVTDYSPIMRVHPWSVCVEYPHNSYIKTFYLLVAVY